MRKRGRRVYLSAEDLEAFDTVVGVFRNAVEGGGRFGADEDDSKGHQKEVDRVSRLADKVQGLRLQFS